MVEIGEGYIGKYVIATLPLVIGPRGGFEVLVPTQVLISHLRSPI